MQRNTKFEYPFKYKQWNENMWSKRDDGITTTSSCKQKNKEKKIEEIWLSVSWLFSFFVFHFFFLVWINNQIEKIDNHLIYERKNAHVAQLSECEEGGKKRRRTIICTNHDRKFFFFLLFSFFFLSFSPVQCWQKRMRMASFVSHSTYL